MKMKKHKNLPDIPLTPDYYQKVQHKFDELTEYRKEVLERLQDAREKGDLSENGAYTAARFELSDTDRELKRLKRLLFYGKVVKPRTDGVAGIGNRVTVTTDNGAEITYMLVTEHESSPSEKKLSITSPLGKVLMGVKEGERVSFEAPAGTKEFTVKKID